MSAISYEEARRFREAASAPLTWDESVPAPPLDRIEFTRLILQAAVNAGLPAPKWEQQLNDYFEAEWRVFHAEIHKYTVRQTYEGIPYRTVSVYGSGSHMKLSVLPMWSEYITYLEDDYFCLWQKYWLYGRSDGSVDNVLILLKQKIWKINTEEQVWNIWKSGDSSYRGNFEFNDNDIASEILVKDYLAPNGLQDLFWWLRDMFEMQCKVILGVLIVNSSIRGFWGGVTFSEFAKWIVVANQNSWSKLLQQNVLGRPGGC